MLKNTYYLILFLSILAALIIGLNIGKRIQSRNLQSATPTPAPLLENGQQLISPTVALKEGTGSGDMKKATESGILEKSLSYTNAACGISLTYPSAVTLEKSSTETVGAIFTSSVNPKDMVVLTCQKDIPKPPLSKENIESVTIGTITASLYHDTSAKDGTKVDALLFTNPKTKLDIFIGGYGPTFTTIIQSLKIL